MHIKILWKRDLLTLSFGNSPPWGFISCDDIKTLMLLSGQIFLIFGLYIQYSEKYYFILRKGIIVLQTTTTTTTTNLQVLTVCALFSAPPPNKADFSSSDCIPQYQKHMGPCENKIVRITQQFQLTGFMTMGFNRVIWISVYYPKVIFKPVPLS